MKFTKLFTKTLKNAPKDETSVNAQYLIRGGFIHKEIAGVYTYLPLGVRVITKIREIVRQEMNKIGGQEMLLSSLQNKEIWEKSGRWSDEVVDVWFKSKINGAGDTGFGASHEEPLTNLLSKYINSYTDLPIAPYQMQTKFRNELRAKSGIMRGREFVMKDMYSFHSSQEDLEEFYLHVINAYDNVFSRAGLGNVTFLTLASGGMFVDGYSHEFQTVCETGEDTIYLDRDKGKAINEEVYDDKAVKALGVNKEKLEKVTAAEVGNIFKLGTKYSKPLELEYADRDGSRKNPIMGCYGIGISRMMGVIVEVFHDDKGIIWPESVAPFKVHMISLGKKEDSAYKKAEELYRKLKDYGAELIWDDREDASAGEKFADADLIGIPYRLVVSNKSLEQGGVEVKKRNEKESKIVDVADIYNLFA
jgi:prolyl-tRNA synthetase